MYRVQCTHTERWYREIVLEGFVFNNVYIDAEIVVNCSQCQGEEGVKEGIDI